MSTAFRLLAAAVVVAASSLPARAFEPARRADDFVDAMGVCTHWGYPDTPYGSAYEQAKKLLGDLGVRHVRDGYHQRLNDLFKTYGIRATLIFSPGPQPPREQIQILQKRIDMAAMVEGPNEVDLFRTNYQGRTFPTGPKEYQTDLYAAIKANPVTKHLGVIAPSTAKVGSNLLLAPLTACDYVVMHSYAGGQMPSLSLEGPHVSNVLNAERILGEGTFLKPIVVTECGYHTALGNTGNAQPGVSERAQAKYLPRTFAEYFHYGIVRTFSYEFLDEFPDYEKDEREANNAEACFGILRRNLRPKPAYVALKNLIALLREATWDPEKLQWDRPDFRCRALDFELSGQTGHVHHTLLQKAGGDFYLLLWQEVSCFDTQAKKDIENPEVSVTLTLNQPVTAAATYLPSRSTDAVQTFAAPKSLSLSVPDEILVVQLTPAPPADTEPPAAPTRLTVRPASTEVRLQWTASQGKTPVAGYFVSRLGRCLGTTKGTGFLDPTVWPGSGFPYRIEAVDAAGNISPPADIVAPTPAVYPDLVVTDLAWEPPHPKVGDAVTFRAAIKNIGDGPTPNGVTLGIAFQVDGLGVTWSDTSKESLLPGASRTLAANNGAKGIATWTMTPGRHDVTAYVDDINRITESDEENNTLTKPLE